MRRKNTSHIYIELVQIPLSHANKMCLTKQRKYTTVLEEKITIQK